MSFNLIYPDVVGTVTGGGRIVGDGIQYVLGLFPQQAFINQPMEIVVLLQNMFDTLVTVNIQIQLPTRDRKGKPMLMEVAKNKFRLKLSAGEAGMLEIPIVAHPPTQPGSNFPVRVLIHSEYNKKAEAVRPPDGGPLPSVLAVSPFRLQVLQDIDFTNIEIGKTPEVHILRFNLAAKQFPREKIKPLTYEKLWSKEQVAEEKRLAESHIEDAQKVAYGQAQGSTYYYFLEVVGEHFADAGLPLHPGEEKAIAKMMAFTVDGMHGETLKTRKDRDKNTRWFRELCQIIGHDESIKALPRGEIFMRYLFDAVLYDAILEGFDRVQKRVKENLGDKQERVAYANRVLTWLVAHETPDLNYIYLPLAMGGILVNKMVLLSRHKQENEWIIINEIREAYRGRMRLASDESVIVFQIMAQLLNEVEADMRQRRVPRP